MKLYPVQINFQVSAEDGAALDAVKHLFNGSRAEVIRACLPYLDRAVKAREPRQRRGTTTAQAVKAAAARTGRLR